VPSSIPISAGTTPQPSILLLEEYDALAAAIGSALKKFAPGHPVSVAGSLAEVEAIASEARPALFIVDVDPAWPGLVDLLERLRDTNPNGRVLVIGTAVPKEITDERGSFGALQFIEKPFELADFGAAVQALLGPWRESDSANSRGTLRGLNLFDILLLQGAAGASAIVEVEAGRKRFGEIHFIQGQVSHAETGKLDGLEALKEMLNWEEASLSEGKKRPSGNRTIHGPWIAVVLELLRQTKSTRADEVFPAAEEPTPAQAALEGAKKIVVIDDTEMLLIFVTDVLATTHPEWQITVAENGASGCKQVERIMPDLILLDYSLPDFNGDEVCRRLLQDERTAQIPVLMMSGHVLEMHAAETRFENIVATIEKPFLSDALIDLVQRTLDSAPLRIEVPTESAAAMGSPERPPAPPAPRKKKPIPVAHSEAATLSRSSAVSPIPAAETAITKTAPAPTSLTTPVISRSKDAVLGLFLDVLSMQFTPQLQMGTIRAKPSSSGVSLHLSSAARDAMPVETGFELGRTELDANGHIATMRLVPTMKPFQPAKTRNAFEIGDVAVLPGAPRESVRLTPTVAAPMTMQLLAHLDLTGVELSPTFQVEHVFLKWRGSRVRVTLSSKATAGESNGAAFEITVVQLDSSGRITELMLNPIR
jgi:DNA-binding response OmpR family regulator